MSRYRPPHPPSSPYITAKGYATLDDELKMLWQRRKAVVQALSDAAAEGDRSENAEYIYRKKELRGIDRRIRYLQKRLPNFKVVRDKPLVWDRIFFGAWVSLEKEDGSEVTYRIVGADETDHTQGFISIDSPLAKALLKKGLDDEIEVVTPTGKQRFCVVKISY